MPDEVWKPVVGYEGWYEVSNMGRVRSVDRHVNHAKGGKALKRGRVMAASKIWSGYCTVQLSRNGRPTSRSVHRLVCEAFHGKPPSERHHAAHNNGVRDDNRADNLRWATPEENEADKEKHGTKPKGDHVPYESRKRGRSHHSAKLSPRQVRAIRKAHKDGAMGAHRLSQIAGVTKQAVNAVIANKTWTHIGDNDA